MAQELQTLDPSVELQKFQPFESELKSAAEKVAGLVITGPDDKKGYKAVTDAISMLTGLRSGIEKTRTAVKAPALNFGRRIDQEAKRLTDMVANTERKLRAERDRIDDEREQIKKDAERRELELFRSRTDAMFAAGFVFDGTDYIAGALHILADGLTGLDEAKFAECLEIGAKEIQAAKAREMVQERPDPKTAQVPVQAFERLPPPALYPNGFDFPTQPIGQKDSEAQDLFELARIKPLPKPENLFPGVGDTLDDLSRKMYQSGFEKCRQDVLAILDKPEKFTRDQLRDLIRALNV